MYGDKCWTEYDCPKELNLICKRKALWICRCRRGYIWDTMNKSCYRTNEHSYDNNSNEYNAVDEIVAFGFYVIPICAFLLMGIICSRGNVWKRLQRHLTRATNGVPHQQQDNLFASSRVFSPLNDMETRSSSGLSPSSFLPLQLSPSSSLPLQLSPNSSLPLQLSPSSSLPLQLSLSSSLPLQLSPSSSLPLQQSPSSPLPLQPPSYMGLFLPSDSLAAAAADSTTASTTSPPPPYEEVHKHKLIFSTLPIATTVILPTAPPIQDRPNNIPGGTFMCNSQGGPN